MAPVPIRGLSKYGIVTSPDMDPFDLPAAAFSLGKNIRFRNGRVTRGPVCRVLDTTAASTPRFLTFRPTTSGYETLLIGYYDGSIATWQSGTETDVSITAYSGSNSELPFTSVFNSNVVYVNRGDRVPWYLGPSASQFATLTNWDANWRCQLLRSLSGALVALNITDTGVSMPQTLRTSEFAVSGAVPTTWDYTVTTNNATENTLAEMQSGIVDAQNLGETIIIYGENEAWQMRLDPGSSNVWDYRKLPFNGGSINANCSVEVNGRHYVFGRSDLYMHDGVSKVSIADNRCRSFVFKNIDMSATERCFVVHNENLKEIMFCYVSGDSLTSFTSVSAANRAAVYNYVDEVWTYYDLPYVYPSSAMANSDTSVTYATVSGTYSTYGGTYLDLGSPSKTCLTLVGATSSGDSLTASLYAFDLPGADSIISIAASSAASPGWYLERTGIDLDELSSNLTDYKLIRSLMPQGRKTEGSADIQIAFGAADYFQEEATYGSWWSWDGTTNYKIDDLIAGRYLAIKMQQDDVTDFSLSGFDLDLATLGER